MSWTQGFASREDIDDDLLNEVEQIIRKDLQESTLKVIHCVYDTNYIDFVLENDEKEQFVCRFVEKKD